MVLSEIVFQNMSTHLFMLSIVCKVEETITSMSAMVLKDLVSSRLKTCKTVTCFAENPFIVLPLISKR